MVLGLTIRTSNLLMLEGRKRAYVSLECNERTLACNDARIWQESRSRPQITKAHSTSWYVQPLWHRLRNSEKCAASSNGAR